MFSSQESRFSEALTAVKDAADDVMDRVFTVKSLNASAGAENTRFRGSTAELRNRISQGKSALRALKSLQMTLNVLSNLAKETTSAIQSILCPLVLQDGIESLPNEILAMIFEYFCVNKDADTNCPVILSHVSRRFRGLALGLPCIWANIDLDSFQSQDKLATWLSRSKESRLDLKIAREIPDSFFSKISNTSVLSRLQTFEFNTFRAFGDDWEEKRLIGILLHHFHDLAFPVLENLSMRFCDYITVSPENLPILCPTWDMRNLRRLTTHNIIPEISSLFHLTSCDMSFGPYGRAPIPGDSVRLLMFLKSTPNLKHLSLKFDSISFPQFDSAIVTLPNLESLSLKVRSGAPDAEGFRRLMDHMRLPALSQLTAAFYFAEGQYLYDWIGYLLFRVSIHDGYSKKFTTARYPVLEDFTLLLRAKRDPVIISRSPLDCISYLAPALKHLTIDAPNIPSPIYADRPCPNLRTLTLRRIFDLASSYVAELIGHKSFRGPLRETFERLEIAACPGLDLEALEKVLPKEKILWRDRAPQYEKYWDMS
ncbi:hypothetical protein DFH11DRAFT_1745393 [Phellopilus nigrolimitatus]|nr:hypothetical protein DFH11DRAFT_1745393 [Phellopilus nigrolimitatus]